MPDRGEMETTVQVQKACAPIGGKIVLKPQKTMRQLLVHAKEKTPSENLKEVVYEVPCRDCEQMYISWWNQEKPEDKNERVQIHSPQRWGMQQYCGACTSTSTQNWLGINQGAFDSTWILEQENAGSYPEPKWALPYERGLWYPPLSCLESTASWIQPGLLLHPSWLTSRFLQLCMMPFHTIPMTSYPKHLYVNITFSPVVCQLQLTKVPPSKTSWFIVFVL